MQNEVCIEMFPAGNGDAFLVHLGSTIWMIDSGYAVTTYENAMKSRLLEIAEQEGRISRMIITHIDRDHISGAIRFLEENKFAASPKVIPIDQIWYNSYRHLQVDLQQVSEIDTASKQELEALQLMEGSILKSNAESEESFVSGTQGSTLAGNILHWGYTWNKDFDGGAVVTETPIPIPQADASVDVTLLTPNKKALEKLSKKWQKELKRKGYVGPMGKDDFFDDALEFMVALFHDEEQADEEDHALVSDTTEWIEDVISKRDNYKEDRSPTNGSSISFLIRYGEKKLLFLGDAIPSQVILQLQRLYPDISKTNPLLVDVLKLSHHGGFSNNSPDLLELVVAKNYLISTNGKQHRHPHLKTLIWVIHSHPKFHKRLVFNYSHNLDKHPFFIEEEYQRFIKKLDDPALQQRYNYEMILPEEEGYMKLEI